MYENPGLRERKKLQQRQTIAAAALRLFSERGFVNVTVADIARATNVSTKTVFNYFPTKEDLVLHGREAIETNLLCALQNRASGESLLAATRRHTLAMAEQMRAVPQEQRMAFRQIMQNTPSVGARWRELQSQHEQAIACLLMTETAAPAEDVIPIVVAGLLGVINRLAFYDVIGWPDEHPRSAAALDNQIERAFDLLARGLNDYGVLTEVV
jgi:AcrR family transcriptional regulator